jgi:hypothetical protein
MYIHLYKSDAETKHLTKLQNYVHFNTAETKKASSRTGKAGLLLYAKMAPRGAIL